MDDIEKEIFKKQLDAIKRDANELFTRVEDLEEQLEKLA